MQANVESQFFNVRNESSLIATLAQQYQGQGGLSEKQRVRLNKAVKHYMTEVWDTNGPMPIQQLNREVIMATTNDFQTYLRREKAPTVNLQEYPDPRNEVPRIQRQAQPTLPYQPRAGPTFEPGMLLDTGTRFEQLQQDRQSGGSSRPVVPDFQIMMEDDKNAPAALTLFENAKKLRDEEASRMKPIGSGASGASEESNPLIRYITPTTLNDANANPTLAMPIVSVPRGPLQQDVLIKQDDILTYKEIEHNLFVYSADRNWVNNTKENRYNFTVNFDTANNQQGFNFSPSANKKFKNIVRIELIKAIMPTEGLESFTNYVSSTITYPKINILSYPYITVRIPELDNNNYGTDNTLDNAFGVLQYDANWYTDTTNLSDGYLAMIPKFMKCQKVYQPTPLATLTKLTIELQKPDGTSLSDTLDTLTITKIYPGRVPTGGTGHPTTTYYSTIDSGSNSYYYVLQTSNWFNQYTFQPGNRIVIQGLNYSNIANTQQAAIFVNQLQNTEGLLIAGIAYLNTGGSTDWVNGTNSVGYANGIIVGAPLASPTTGLTTVTDLGGNPFRSTLTAATIGSGSLLNLTHQTHLVFRIVTREMDPTARVRPDNL